ncbi:MULTISPECIES: cobalamin biosynthesis protein [Phyllobacteriaceae]|jgi:cobalt-precorrin 5A hydrolase|nr:MULTISPECIES: cobalamin biosynthesis protein [Mesorhizobium]MDQ0328562.1 cobalt-precorrin 5A hydrolase [Mesorhizobium sp. YL-MeA3-2017]
MELGQDMIVAGIGCRKGADTASVIAAIDAVLAGHSLDRSALSVLATTTFKKDEVGIFAAARKLGLEVIVVEVTAADEPGGEDTLTRSEISLAIAGSSSVSESAALAAAGEGARLLGPRIIVGAVTCAIATSGASA